jgi:hypothetical protein
MPKHAQGVPRFRFPHGSVNRLKKTALLQLARLTTPDELLRPTLTETYPTPHAAPPVRAHGARISLPPSAS